MVHLVEGTRLCVPLCVCVRVYYGVCLNTHTYDMVHSSWDCRTY